MIYEHKAMKLTGLPFVLLTLSIGACSKAAVVPEVAPEAPSQTVVPAATTSSPSATAAPASGGAWEASCLKAGGRYAKNECEGIDGASCKSIGGSWDACASPCRHQPEPPDACITVCVEICQAPVGK